MTFLGFLIPLLLLSLGNAVIQPLDKEVIRQIYQQSNCWNSQDKVYIIYAHGNMHDFEVESIFNSHCFGDKLCSVLEPNNPNYYDYLQFIGYHQSDFFIIFDPSNKRKFIHPINKSSFTSNDLLSFQYKYLYKELQPFFASEPVSEEKNEKCSKLVGKNVGEFLRQPHHAKVILLYNLNQSCQQCERVLIDFVSYAETHADESNLKFGYFNTFLNDHPIIQDEKTPSFLIFIDQKHQTPFQLQSDKISDLSYFLSNTLNQILRESSPQQKNEEEKNQL